MTEPVVTPPAATPPAATPPAGASPPAAPPAPVARPEWLPEAHWDTATSAIKPEFGTHYGELASQAEQIAALRARKPEDIKPEIKLPADFKVPDGVNIKIDEKDPRLPALRQIAVEHGLSADAVNALVTLDARMKIDAQNANMAAFAEDQKKLGANVETRKSAVTNWAKGLLDRKEISADEHQELLATSLTAAGVSLIEKIMAKSSGSVPGTTPERPATPAPKTVAERMWPGGFVANPQARAS